MTSTGGYTPSWRSEINRRMPALYFAKQGAPPVRRAILTFLELRGMFGAYDANYLSDDWSSVIRNPSCLTGCVIAEITSRDGVTQHYPRAGLYHLLGLSTAKVEEVLKYRDGHSQRLTDADQWELEKRPGTARLRGGRKI